ncbi:hypothetical protein FD754_010239 [Muntiacus muntjak]|uniref:RRM domain-containing protein n=1 Tax=Muntiacus muntjak TaxID=9888 RepID=A0A5N3WXF9_MUNMU|nr:hypothetical protein FD754_010239 [Muntiacus muntjak]
MNLSGVKKKSLLEAKENNKKSSTRAPSKLGKEGSSGSPSPSQGRQDNRWHSCSISRPPKRDGKGRKRQNPSPKSTKVHNRRLTRNVTKGHIVEMFSTCGKIKMTDMSAERMHPHLGKIDGQKITAAAVLAPWTQPSPRRLSPPRRMLPSPPMGPPCHSLHRRHSSSNSSG